jgi:uncharacterized membrane protein YcaP (DUF421 family)
MNHYLSITVELFFGFAVLFILMKLLGKVQFSQITPFDFISALILGELLGNAVYDHEVKLGEIIFATTFWGLLIFSMEKITQKYIRSRAIFEGKPSIIVHKGIIDYQELKKNHLDINQLQSLTRQEGYFSLQEVEYAILETNGKVSVLPKAEFDVPKKPDLNVPLKPTHLPVTLIIDGKIISGNLQELGLDENWLKNQLEASNISDTSEVLFAEWIEGKPLHIMEYH